MANYADILELALQRIMVLYKCNDPLDALIRYCLDYEKDGWLKMKAKGGTREEYEQHMAEEYRRFEMGRLTNPEMAAANNKLIILLEKYPPRKSNKGE